MQAGIAPAPPGYYPPMQVQFPPVAGTNPALDTTSSPAMVPFGIQAQAVNNQAPLMPPKYTPSEEVNPSSSSD